MTHELTRRRWLHALAATPVTASLTPWSAHAGATPPPGEADVAAFDRRLRERQARDLVGVAAVQVGPWGQTVHALGRRRQGQPEAIDEATVFELGSLTKVFVALALAEGVTARRWRLEDAVEDSLPDGLRLRDTQGQPLRLIDLATHRSGLPRMPANLGQRELANVPYAGYNEQRLWEFLRGWTSSAQRGSRFEYSNLGFGLLGLALARRDGRTLDTLLADRVFAPLGIEGLRIRRPPYAGDDPARVAAAFQETLQPVGNLAIGHDAQRQPTPPWHYDALAGAVGLIGPVKPVGHFLQAALGLFPHPLQEAFALCLQPRAEGEDPLHPFGLAWEVSMIPGPAETRRLYNQDGATGGYSSSMWLEPARRRGVIVLANSFTETRELALSGLDRALTEQDFGLAYMPVDQLRAFAGRYRAAKGGTLTVSIDGTRLWMRDPSGTAVELLYQQPRRFVVRDRPMLVEFDAGPPRSLSMITGGRAVGPRYEREP